MKTLYTLILMLVCCVDGITSSEEISPVSHVSRTSSRMQAEEEKFVHKMLRTLYKFSKSEVDRHLEAYREQESSQSIMTYFQYTMQRVSPSSVVSTLEELRVRSVHLEEQYRHLRRQLPEDVRENLGIPEKILQYARKVKMEDLKSSGRPFGFPISGGNVEDSFRENVFFQSIREFQRISLPKQYEAQPQHVLERIQFFHMGRVVFQPLLQKLYAAADYPEEVRGASWIYIQSAYDFLQDCFDTFYASLYELMREKNEEAESEYHKVRDFLFGGRGMPQEADGAFVKVYKDWMHYAHRYMQTSFYLAFKRAPEEFDKVLEG